MNHAMLLVLEAAQRCQDAIATWRATHDAENERVDKAHQMCLEIEQYAEHWPLTRLNRWLGFVLGVLESEAVLSREEQSTIMRGLLVRYPEKQDRDLRDHRDPLVPFQLDLGGSE